MLAGLTVVFTAAPAQAQQAGTTVSAPELLSPNTASGGAGASAITVLEAAPETTAEPARAKAAKQDQAPQGSPMVVQLLTIAVVLALGVAYFWLMSRSGRGGPQVNERKQAARA